jgi:hypothetical protein
MRDAVYTHVTISKCLRFAELSRSCGVVSKRLGWFFGPPGKLGKNKDVNVVLSVTLSIELETVGETGEVQKCNGNAK